MTLHVPYQLKTAVTFKGAANIVVGVALNDKDEMFYIVRDEQGRARRAFHHEMSLA